MLHSVLTRARMFSFALVLLGLTVATTGSARDFEVWLVDQSDSFGKTYGGAIYIYEGADSYISWQTRMANSWTESPRITPPTRSCSTLRSISSMG
jgi:hypothetical protein